MSIKIGLSMRVMYPNNYIEPRDAISHDWINFLLLNDFEVVLIPNCGDKVTKFLDSNNINRIILTNGNDISNDDNNNELSNISELRDYTENLMIEWAIENDIAILGVCRGAQLINLFYGGSLTHNLEKNHIAINHNVNICDDITSNYFGKLYFETNSYHKHGIYKHNLAQGLTPFAISEDGIIEGYYNNSKILSIQWHPERKFSNNPYNKLVPLKFLLNGPWW